MGEKNEATLLWLSRRVGISYNEGAHELPRKRAQTPFIAIEPRFGVPWAMRKQSSKVWMRKEHRNVWSQYESGKHTKVFLASASNNTKNALLDLDRTVMTNHCSLNKHLFTIGYTDSTRCLCGSGEDTGHTLSVIARGTD